MSRLFEALHVAHRETANQLFRTPANKGITKSFAKVTEVVSSSTKSIDDAVSNGVERVFKTLKGIKRAWGADQKVTMKDGKVEEYGAV